MNLTEFEFNFLVKKAEKQSMGQKWKTKINQTNATMTKELTSTELIQRAINDAIQWNLSYLDSITNCAGDPVWDQTIEDTKDIIRQLNQYRHERFG